jgi:putative hydroxymethylpyrimidine transport system ATP-binding protein
LNICFGIWFIREAIGLSNSDILLVKNLSYAFPSDTGKKDIFQDVSLDVKHGEFVSVIGASGSGKSTLFRIIAGLLEPDIGDIWLDGCHSENRLGQTGYMPQKDLLLPWRTIIDNVILPLEISKQNKQSKLAEIREWLSRFGLADYEAAYPHELSGGMKQRAAFLRTMLIGKDLLLLDEPFGALDALTKRTMHSWLLELWGELQKTVLFITHDLEEAILLSDRIYLLPGDIDKKVQEVKVNLPRPRKPELIYHSDFIRLRQELEWLIHDET